MDSGVFPRDEAPFDVFRRRPEPFVKGERVAPRLTPAAEAGRVEAVSLIVPTFFNQRLKEGVLRRLLAGLERSSAVREVVLVASGGVADDVEALAAPIRGKEVRIVASDPGRRARSRNVGAASAAHDLLLFLDDDMLLADWRLVDVLVAGLLGRGFDCALFPRRHYARYPLLYDDEVLGRFIAGWREAGDAFEDPHLFDPVRQGSPHKTVAFCFPGCFTLIRREAFDRIGGFPEEYVGWGFEDTAFAMRAVTSLRVWNLFWESPPLLHIDHPVSPYKSEEFQWNLGRFLVEHKGLDMDWLCREAVGGGDFGRASGGRPDTSAYLEPLRSAAAACGLRLGADFATGYRAFIEARAKAGRAPFPEHVVLHGSRAEGTATSESDYDLLALFADGTAVDFYVGGGEGGPRIEVEFAEAGKYEQIASGPAYHSLAGPLELAKVAKAVVLVGDAVAWEAWRGLLLSTALRRGRACWLIFALGLELWPGKLGPMKGLFLASLRAVLARADADRYGEDIELLRGGQPESLAAHIGALLDREHPNWRRDLAAGRRVFAQQVPAVWIALRWVQRHH